MTKNWENEESSLTKHATSTSLVISSSNTKVGLFLSLSSKIEIGSVVLNGNLFFNNQNCRESLELYKTGFVPRKTIRPMQRFSTDCFETLRKERKSKKSSPDFLWS